MAKPYRLTAEFSESEWPEVRRLDYDFVESVATVTYRDPVRCGCQFSDVNYDEFSGAMASLALGRIPKLAAAFGSRVAEHKLLTRGLRVTLLDYPPTLADARARHRAVAQQKRARRELAGRLAHWAKGALYG